MNHIKANKCDPHINSYPNHSSMAMSQNPSFLPFSRDNRWEDADDCPPQETSLRVKAWWHRCPCQIVWQEGHWQTSSNGRPPLSTVPVRLQSGLLRTKRSQAAGVSLICLDWYSCCLGKVLKKSTEPLYLSFVVVLVAHVTFGPFLTGRKRSNPASLDLIINQ